MCFVAVSAVAFFFSLCICVVSIVWTSMIWPVSARIWHTKVCCVQSTVANSAFDPPVHHATYIASYLGHLLMLHNAQLLVQPKLYPVHVTSLYSIKFKGYDNHLETCKMHAVASCRQKMNWQLP